MIEVSGPERTDRRRTTQGLRLCFINVPGTRGDDIIQALGSNAKIKTLRADLPYLPAWAYAKHHRMNNTVLVAVMRNPRNWIEAMWRELKPEQPFEEFIIDFANGGLGYDWRFQSDFLLKSPTKYNRPQVNWDLAVKRVFTFQKRQKLVDWLQQRLGVELDIGRAPDEPIEPKASWTPQVFAKFATLYARDIELFERLGLDT